MENQPQDIKRIAALAEDRGLSNFTLAYFDHSGRLRAKYYNTSGLEKAMTDGTAMNLGIFAASLNEVPMETSPFLDPDNQFRDAAIRLMADTCRDFPLDGDKPGLLLIGELIDEYRAYCPRAFLSTELARYEQMGLRAYGAFEFEWYLLEETSKSIASKVPDSINVRSGFEVFYSFVDQIVENALFRDVIDCCETMSMPVETIHTEFTQIMEAALRPALGAAIADNGGLFKAVMKATARKHGLLASFMARRNMIEQGCGAHINLSLRNKDDNNVFFAEETPDKLSDTMRHFIGGLQRYTPELFLMQAPNLNSYRRYQPGLFTPLSNTWGVNNKTVAFRAVNANRDATRVESRLPGADTNPHLALTGMLMAGRKGIEECIEPAEATAGDGWSVESPEELALPLEFTASIDRFEQSRLARETLGDGFVDCYVASRRWQIEDQQSTVTDWELRTFLEGA